MDNTQRNLIEYRGIYKCPIKNNNNFNQINLEEVFCIPNQKPDMEQINKVWAEGVILDYKIVKTPIGTSLEGQVATGYKLLVCGDLKMKVEYVACEAMQTVHTAHNSFPFCAYAVLPESININTRITPNIVIEDIFSEQIDGRCIYNNITMMLIIDLC